MYRSTRAPRSAAALLARAAAPVAIALCLFSPDARSASYIWDGELSNSFHHTFQNKTNWSPEQVPGPADSATITGADVVIAAVFDLTVGTLTTTGGSLTLSAPLTINNSGIIANPIIRSNLTAVGAINLNGIAEWSSGVISGAGGVTNSGAMTVVPAAGDRIVAGQFTNQGTFSLNYNMRIQDASFLNTGTFNLNNQINNFGNGQLFNNNLILTTGVGSINTRLISSGTISASTPQSGPPADLLIAGPSQITGGSFSLAGGATIRLEGISVNHVIDGDVTAGGVGDLSTRNNLIVNGSLNSSLEGARGLYLQSGSVTGPGSITNTKTAVFGGTVISNTGGFTNESGGTLSLNNDAVHFVNSKLLNRGKIIHDARNLDVSSEAGLDNQPGATYELRGGTGGYDINGLGSFENRGTILKKDPNTVTMNLRLNHRGTIDIQQGALSLRNVGDHHAGAEFKVSQGATLNFNFNHAFRGSTHFEGLGTANLSELINFASGTATFNMTGGGAIWNDPTDTMFIEGNVDNKANFAIGGLGKIEGVGTGKFLNSAGGTLTVFAGPTLSAPLENNGAITHQNGANLRFDTDATLTNLGNYNVTTGQISQVNPGNRLFANLGGTFTKTAPGTFTVDVPFNNFGGTVDVQIGNSTSPAILALPRGGVFGEGAQFKVAQFAELQLPGTYTATGDVNFSGAGVVRLRGAYNNINGNSTFSVGAGLIGSSLLMELATTQITTFGQSQVIFDENVHWQLGTLSGGTATPTGEVSGGFVNDGIIDFQAGSSRRLTGALANNSLIRHSIGAFELLNGTLVNNGNYLAIPNATIISITGTGGRFINKGELQVRGTLNVFVPFDFSAGLVEVDTSATLAFHGGGNSTGAGNYDLFFQGSTIRFNGGVHTFNGAYQADGQGQIQLLSGEIRGDFFANLQFPGTFLIDGGAVNGADTHPVTNLGEMDFKSGQILGSDGLLNLGSLKITNTPQIRTVIGRINNADHVAQNGSFDLQGLVRNQQDGVWATGAGISGTGLFDNFGYFLNNPGSAPVVSTRFNNIGFVEAAPNSILRLAGPVNQFNIPAQTLTGGEWIIIGRLTLGAGEPINVLDAAIHIDPAGIFTNLSTTGFENKGTLTLDGNHQFTGLITNTGTLNLFGRDGANPLSLPSLTNNGKLHYAGRVRSNIFNNGEVNTGQSPGQITLIGNFTQTANGTLNVELAGPTIGTQYDSSSISGAATLAGELHLSLLDGFVPTPYTPFTILTATSITGTFDTITGLDTGNGFSFATSYFAEHVEVMSVLAGDLNLDQQVTIADFIDLASNFNTTGATWRDGDINGDGTVSISDFIDLASHFNRSYVAGGPALGSVVPEPGCIALLGLLPLALRRRRLRRSLI